MAERNEAYKLDPENPPEYTERTNVAQQSPPSYTASLADPPPSYESLYGRVKAAKEESSGFVSFMKSFLVIIMSTIGVTVIIGIFLAVPISMIVIGAIYKDDCPAERMIPIYLIVAGSFGVATNLFSLFKRCRKSEEERQEDQKKVNPIEGIVNCFMFAWFIAGCVFIYRTKDEFQSKYPDEDDYCNHTLYWFAFWITTSVYIIMAASCCCVCLIGCLASCFVKN